MLACYIRPKSAHVFSCFILNNYRPPSAHAFHWCWWWMDGRTDRQICDQLAGMKAIKQCTCNHHLLTSMKVQIGFLRTKQSETSTRVFVGKITVTTYTCRYGNAPRIPRLVEQLFHKLPDPETVLIGVARGPVPDP